MNSGAKIVLVEDELIIAASIAKELRRAGYDVVGIALSAEQALAAIEERRPQLVLMDIRIRGPIDGIQAAQQIATNFTIPVIFMSAQGDKETLDRAKAVGASAYLVKPVARDVALNRADKRSARVSNVWTWALASAWSLVLSRRSRLKQLDACTFTFRRSSSVAACCS